jgi:hypothetical protein
MDPLTIRFVRLRDARYKETGGKMVRFVTRTVMLINGNDAAREIHSVHEDPKTGEIISKLRVEQWTQGDPDKRIEYEWGKRYWDWVEVSFPGDEHYGTIHR